MKAYVAGPGPGGEPFAWTGLVFAPDMAEARRVAWQSGIIAASCDHEYPRLQVRRALIADAFAQACGRKRAHVCYDDRIKQALGWRCEDESPAACRGLVELAVGELECRGLSGVPE